MTGQTAAAHLWPTTNNRRLFFDGNVSLYCAQRHKTSWELRAIGTMGDALGGIPAARARSSIGPTVSNSRPARPFGDGRRQHNPILLIEIPCPCQVCARKQVHPMRWYDGRRDHTTTPQDLQSWIEE